MTVRIALTGATWWQSTASITSSTERAPERTGTTGIGATTIPTGTSECVIAAGSKPNSGQIAALARSFGHTATELIRLGNPGGEIPVSDEGQGIPDGILGRSSRTKTVGVGITDMRERVNQLGGRLEIEASRGGSNMKMTTPNSHCRTLAPVAVSEMAGSAS